MDEYFETKKKIEEKKDEIEKLKKKFIELKSLVYDYKEEKDKEINSLQKEQVQFKSELENLNNGYEKIIDDASNQIEEFINNVALDLGGIDVLINNAGINRDNLSIRMKDEEWKKVIDINLTSTFLLCKHSIKIMLKNKFGRIVNITSIVGHTGNLGQSNYAASKAGIIGMSKSLAIEYAKKNITINCVSPGFIDTDMTTNIAEKVKLFLTSRIPMGRLGSGEDVSNCVAFLSSDSASYITGETLHVNGGMYMS